MQLRECRNECGWLFAASRTDAARCNDCEGDEEHLRVCRADDRTIDGPTLQRLARHVMGDDLKGTTPFPVVAEKISEFLVEGGR